jgi:carbamoyltransferase
MRDYVNKIIKNRESFRPFAPAILYEYKNLFFENVENIDSNYMEKVAYFKKILRNKLPSVVHVDGTGRLQTVNKEINKKFYLLINEFYKLTGFPILLNTSFNVDGEPIVKNPQDALRNFFSSGLDMLVINDFLIEK